MLLAAPLAPGAVELPEGDARPTLVAACSTCHTLEIVTEKRWTEARWRETVDAMVARGAPLKKEEFADVVGYLTRHFGTSSSSSKPAAAKDRGRVLVEDICSLCHELDRIKVQEFTREEWTSEIKGMISEGAPVTDEEFELIVDYLASNYGRAEIKDKK